MPISVLKSKDLVGIPWMTAFALRADGWWLRQDIIWAKPNPMPESVTDRCTKAHEYLFLLSKRERYFFDQDALREPTGNEATMEEYEAADGRYHFHEADLEQGQSQRNPAFVPMTHPLGRNRRSVWTIATEPHPDAHFATFPIALVEPCVLAGSRPGDVVLDPFMGSGTVAKVAQNLGRCWVGCELNPDYVAMQRTRAA